MTAPLVLLHAFPLDARMWDGVRERLPADREVLAPHLPGFGGRELPRTGPDLAVFAADVVATLDHAGIDRAVLCGVSMGGYVVMELLRRAPERLAGIVLADTKAGADPQPARDNRERVATTLLEERTPRVLLEELLPKVLGATTRGQRPGVVEAVRAIVGSVDVEGAAWAQRAMAARPDSSEDLVAARVPALVVVGAEDELSPPADAQAMAQALPDAELVVIPQAGHLAAVEDPGSFAEALGRWLPRV